MEVFVCLKKYYAKWVKLANVVAFAHIGMEKERWIFYSMELLQRSILHREYVLAKKVTDIKWIFVAKRLVPNGKSGLI